jgi:hypothetical protein
MDSMPSIGQISLAQVIRMRKELKLGIFLIAVMAGIIIFILGQQGMIPGLKNSTIEQSTQVPIAGSSDVAGRISHNLIMSQSITNASMDEIMVYKVLPPVVTNETTLEYASKFNVTGNLRGETTVQSKDLEYYVTITKNSGAITYQNQDRPNAIMDAPAELPSDDEAVTIATNFLKDRDLYPEGSAFSSTYDENAYSTKNTITFGQIDVFFNRTLNGLNVEGTHLEVDVGGNGDVIGYYSNWRNYEPYMEYPIIPQQEAFEQLKTNGVGVGMNDQNSIVSIDHAYLAYNTLPGAYQEDYLKPVWVFKGNVLVNGTPVMPIVQPISAVSVEVESNATQTMTTS